MENLGNSRIQKLERNLNQMLKIYGRVPKNKFRPDLIVASYDSALQIVNKSFINSWACK